MNMNNQRGDIPEGWSVVKLEEISSDFVSGGTPSTSNESYWGGDIPWITSAFMSEKPISKGFKNITGAGLNNSATHLVPKNSILVATRVGVGKVAISLVDVAISQDITGVILKEGNDLRFVYWALRKQALKFKRLSQGSTIKGILKRDLARTHLLLPLLPEQRAIASVLSTVDDAVAKADEAIAKTERLKRGLMDRFFKNEVKDYDFKPIQELFDVTTGTTPSTKEGSFWKDAFVNWITPADLGKLDGELAISESEKKVSKKALDKTNLTLMPKESIIMSTRAPVGYLAILKEESTFNQGCKGLTPKDWEATNTYYYAYYLLSQKSALGNRSGQSTFKELSKDMLESFEVPTTSRSEQDSVVDGLSLVDAKIRLEKSRKGTFELIKNGLMDELLTGKKRVTLPT